MTIGALGFLNPLLLTALAALPIIWWLLRTMPPRPRRIEFPATRILKELQNKEQTPSRSPWWLTLIRLLAAGFVILALAEPVLNPEQSRKVTGTGPVVIVVDNSWAGAGRWSLRRDMIGSLINQAESQSRPIVVAPTAHATQSIALKLEGAATARETAAAVIPQPFDPSREATLAAIQQALGDKKAQSVVWLTDGLDYGEGRKFIDALVELAGGAANLTVFTGADGEEALGLNARLAQDGKLIAQIKRAGGPIRTGIVQALSARGQRLGEVQFTLAANSRQTEATLEMPLELRNQVTRLDIASLPSAGAVHLLDARSRWHRVALIASTSTEQAQPLLSPLYYLQRALAPHAELAQPKEPELPAAIASALNDNSSVLMLADVGKLPPDMIERLTAFTKRGGVIVRFAGPRLETHSDELLPAPLRMGGRTLGGALSWSTPQPLAAFEAESLFAGLAVPPDVLVTRQVLTDPARIGPAMKTWARLKDGTPLVTAEKRGEGWVVLFHVTANPDWSNLPISGLFVEMTRRIITLATISTSGKALTDATQETKQVSTTPDVLAPVETLNGFGELKAPPVTAKGITSAELATMKPGPEHPPGFYGPAASPRALNLVTAMTELKALPSLPFGVNRFAYHAEKAEPLKPYLLSAALGLIFVDIIAVLLLQGVLSGLFRGWRRAAAPLLILLIATGVAALLVPVSALAQTQPRSAVTPEELFALKSTLKVRFGYVLTGDTAVDRASRAGLMGLNRVLVLRTSVDPAEPMGVDIAKDELAFFPLLYWPVLNDAKQLPANVLARVDAYMKQGGLIVFDTRDHGQAIPTAQGLQGPGALALQRLLSGLDAPRLEPVPEHHVLTKSFYLLKSFPGRFDGGTLWVEAESEAEKADTRRARRADGVSSLIITSNDFASAWAIDESGRGVFPVTPGGELQREMSYRTGINIVMYALTGNYKADQVHVEDILKRLGQ
ncbi:MAG: DUF4159 domain-containing protein [Hyphomicrobiaceae bacterium]|nr:MAG: DUF4159 domain-containing protein [Hyphomicrobiaceae bacterium]